MAVAAADERPATPRKMATIVRNFMIGFLESLIEISKELLMSFPMQPSNLAFLYLIEMVLDTQHIA